MGLGNYAAKEAQAMSETKAQYVVTAPTGGQPNVVVPVSDVAFGKSFKAPIFMRQDYSHIDGWSYPKDAHRDAFMYMYGDEVVKHPFERWWLEWRAKP